MQQALNTLADLPWSLVIALGVTGIPMALLSSLIGMKQKVEVPLWWALYAVWVAIVLLLHVSAPFTTILVASLFAGVLHSITQSLLVKQYRRNNPWYADQMKGSERKLAARFLAMGIVIGVVFGAIVGAIAWGIARL